LGRRNGSDWGAYERCFQKEILSNPKALAKLKEIKKLAKEKDVRLICYEKNPPCHRFILIDLINSLYFSQNKRIVALIAKDIFAMLLLLVKGESLSGLKFRSLLVEDACWIAEVENDSEVAKYYISVYPRTEHEIRESVKKWLEDGREKHLVAELDGEPAGCASVGPSTGRSRHVAWLGIFVRHKHWGKGVGSALMDEAVTLAKGLGCRKLMLGTTEGNDRAINLYKKFGFETETYVNEEAYVNGSWRKSYIMGLELAPCEPKISGSLSDSSKMPRRSFLEKSVADIVVRQLMDGDLEEVHRLQSCPESTKSSRRIPPVTKEETKKWYEALKSMSGRHCLACFENNKLLGYLRFVARPLPFSNLNIEEMIVDVNERPEEATAALITAIKDFKDRYGYRRIFGYIPQTSTAIVKALKNHGFKTNGAMKSYYFIDGYYVDIASYEYP